MRSNGRGGASDSVDVDDDAGVRVHHHLLRLLGVVHPSAHLLLLWLW